jgi:hypothetical protein
MKLFCSQCRRESSYDYGTLFDLLPENLRPKPLSQGLVYAILLAEVNASQSMPRCFFGERILTRVTQQSNGWRGQTIGKSQFCARTLPPRTEVAGPIIHEHFVIDARRAGTSDVPVEIEEVPKNSCFAMMISPRDDPSLLLSANPFCPNPSCRNVCSLTFTQFKNAIENSAAKSPSPDTTLVWECELCHATMVVGLDTYNDLYKM